MRKDIFSSTRRKIMSISIGIVMGTLLIFAFITQAIYKQSLFDEVDQQLLTHKNMIVNQAHVQYVDGQVIEVVLPSPLVKEFMNYVWYNGELIKDSPHMYKGSNLYPIFPKDKMDEVVSIDDEGYHYRGIQFEYKGCVFQLLLSVDNQVESLANLQQALFNAFLALIFIVLVVSFFLAKIALKPLYKAYQKQSLFIQDASHEMRTPLAVMRGKLELIVRSPQDKIENHYEAFSGMMTQLSGLEKMNKDLLLLSKEDMQGVLEIKKVKAHTLLDELAEFYTELSEMYNLEFKYESLNGEDYVEWDLVKVRRCLSILLENAIKYSNPTGCITLSSIVEEKYLKVTVSDTGRGMKESEIKHIFDRFYRSSEVRASGIEGSGIGLSLLQSLAYTMGIKIKVSSVYGKGSQFTLWIPKNMSDKSLKRF